MLRVIKRKRSRQVTQWLKKEKQEQVARHKKIVAEQDALGPKRDRWVSGFNVHSDMLRKIDAKEIPKKPRRKFKVVF